MAELEDDCDRWSSGTLFPFARLSGDMSGSDCDLPCSFRNREAAVDFFELLPCVVVDVERIELLAEEFGRGSSELGRGARVSGKSSNPQSSSSSSAASAASAASSS